MHSKKWTMQSDRVEVLGMLVQMEWHRNFDICQPSGFSVTEGVMRLWPALLAAQALQVQNLITHDIP